MLSDKSDTERQIPDDLIHSQDLEKSSKKTDKINPYQIQTTELSYPGEEGIIDRNAPRDGGGESFTFPWQLQSVNFEVVWKSTPETYNKM